MKRALEEGESEKPGAREPNAKGRLWIRARVCSQDRLGTGCFLYWGWGSWAAVRLHGERGADRNKCGLERRDTLSAEMKGKVRQEAQSGMSLIHQCCKRPVGNKFLGRRKRTMNPLPTPQGLYFLSFSRPGLQKIRQLCRPLLL